MPARRTTQIRRGPRRKTVWARAFGVNVAIPTTPNNVQDDLMSGTGSIETALGANSILGATVGRIRGVINVEPGVFTTDVMCRVGVKVDDANSSAINEGPFTNPYDDWMLWEPFSYLNGGAVVADLQDTGQILSRVIDVKAMRKLSELNQTLFLYGESSSGAVSWTMNYDLSILLLLP